MKNSPIFIIIGILYQNAWVDGKEREYFQIFNAEKHEIKQQQIGDNIKFKCELKVHNGDSITGNEIKWYFKPCETDSDIKSCNDYYNDNNWKTIQCKMSPCRILYLENLTENDSGIYKCTIFPYKLDETRFLNIQLVKKFRLNVKNSTVLAPEFSEDFPTNETALIGNQTVLQCRVNSKVTPTIKWFKGLKQNDNYSSINRRDANNTINLRQINHRIFEYFEKLYELLDTDGEKIISEDLYLSKLILNDVKLEDEGFYACLAINYQGLNIRETYLKVYSGTEVIHEDEISDPNIFLILFSMPLGLISLPLLCWSIYFCRRKITRNHQKYIENDEERELHGAI